MPLTSIQCWHVHCEECWLRTLVRLLATFLLTCRLFPLFWDTLFKSPGGRVLFCFILNNLSSVRADFPSLAVLTPRSGFDWGEFRLSRHDQGGALPLACSSAAVGTAVAHVRALCWGQPCLTVISCGASMQRGKAVRMEAKSTEISWNG